MTYREMYDKVDKSLGKNRFYYITDPFGNTKMTSIRELAIYAFLNMVLKRILEDEGKPAPIGQTAYEAVEMDENMEILTLPNENRMNTTTLGRALASLHVVFHGEIFDLGGKNV